MTSRTRSARRIWGILKKSELSSASGEDDWLSLTRRSQASGLVPHVCVCVGGGADGKVLIERWRISLPYVETFNSKVIKGFVPELRSHYVYFVFRDSYVYMLRTLYVRFTHIHIWLWYNYTFVFTF